PGRLADGDNTLTVEPADTTPDDIRVGEITLDDRPPAAVLSEATVEVAVREERPDGPPVPVPARVTVVDDRGSLMTTGAASAGRRAGARLPGEGLGGGLRRRRPHRGEGGRAQPPARPAPGLSAVRAAAPHRPDGGRPGRLGAAGQRRRGGQLRRPADRRDATAA